MYRVKVKKACGGLTKKQEGGISDERTEVSSSMGPVPREEANIEVEKGESAFGDINGDSFAELMFFGGKRHHSGGTPVNVPPGTFILSDTAKLRIKDPELLKKFFNINNPKKKGYTPAEITKQYKGFNDYMNTLRDQDADDIKVATAYEMVNNITNKIGSVALIQEAMKGFPDGIPSFAESAAIGMGLDPEQLVQMAPKQEEAPAQQMPQGDPNMMGEMQRGGMMKQMYGIENSIPKAQTGGWDTDISKLYKGEGLSDNWFEKVDKKTKWDQLKKALSEGQIKVDGKWTDLNAKGANTILNTFLKAYEDPTDENLEAARKYKSENIDVDGLGWVEGTPQDQLQMLFDDADYSMLNQRRAAVNANAEHSSKLKEAENFKKERQSYLELLKYRNSLDYNPQIESKITQLEDELKTPAYKKVDPQTEKSALEMMATALNVNPYTPLKDLTYMVRDGIGAIEPNFKRDFEDHYYHEKTLGLDPDLGNDGINKKKQDFKKQYKDLIKEINKLDPNVNLKYDKPDEGVSLKSNEGSAYFGDIKSFEDLKKLSDKKANASPLPTDKAQPEDNLKINNQETTPDSIMIDGVKFKVGNF